MAAARLMASSVPQRPAKGRWLEISARVPFEYVEPVASLFHRYGKGVVIEEDADFNPDEGESAPPAANATIRTYLPVSQRYQRSREMMWVGLRLIVQLAPGAECDEREIVQQEWETAWKVHFTPLRVGDRLVVRPPWHTEALASHEVSIEIDPGLAFGTGHHPTTRMTLECLERLMAPGANVLDVGCGSGILSIAAAKLGAESVLGVDVDKVAIRSARANIRANGVGRSVRLVVGSLPNGEAQAGAADIALANISAKALIELASQLRGALRDGGYLVASGLLTERSADVRQAFAEAGLAVSEELIDGDWAAMICRTT